MQKWQIRIAPSLGDGFAGHPNDVWGTVPYTNPQQPCVFFGMYGLADFQALWNHTGERAVLWCGSDIRNLLKDYWLDKHGSEKIKVHFPMHVDHFVENSLEQIALASVGIESKIVPSFLGDVSKFTPQEIKTKKRYYTSVSGDNFSLYGWDEIDDWAARIPDAEFHLYGNRGDYPTKMPNVFLHGRLSQEGMDTQIKTMTGALRLTRFDGASEILVKSTLWGQTPISPYIYYDWLGNRDKLLSVVNKYPWNVQNN